MELYRALFKAAIRPLSTPLPISSVRDRIAILLFAVYGKKNTPDPFVFIYLWQTSRIIQTLKKRAQKKEMGKK